MKKFYLNRQFFDFYLGCYYPVLDNIFLHVLSCKTIYKDYKKFQQYECEFCNRIVRPQPFRDSFCSVFRFKVNVCNRKVQSFGFEYLMESKSKVAQFKYFPLSPAWLLPVTNYELWLSRCRLSLLVYLKEGWL